MTCKEYADCDPVFRENIELIDERYLQMLAMCPDYSIY